MATKKHKHKFETFVRWVRTPWSEDDVSRHWHFSVDGRCKCGEVGQRDALLSEVESYIKERTCTNCGKFNYENAHKSGVDCFSELRSRIAELEGVIERMRDSMRSI